MTKKTIYISGKIGDLPKDVFEFNFFRAEQYLNHIGWIVINPVKLDHSDHDKSWASFMIKDIQALIPCEAIYMLSNWTNSPGARIEHEFAVRMGKQIIYESRL